MAEIKVLSKESIIKAIQQIDSNQDLLKGRESHKYDLVYNGNTYPPILVLSEANKIQGGETLTLSDFNNNTDKAFQLLNDLGFEVREKNETNGEQFYRELTRFIKQAQTENLKTKDYINEYQGLKVKVSFGQGNTAKVPWIALLGYSQKVTEGIYPVYLYFKRHNILILAYGVSETNTPSYSWKLDKTPTISEYFQKELNTTPDRYGASYVHSVYEIEGDSAPEKSKAIQDLNHLVNYYKKIMEEQPETKTEKKGEVVEDPTSAVWEIYDYIESKGFFYEPWQIATFITALKTKPFVILGGISGTGKSKLPQLVMEATNNEDILIPVKPDWTDSADVLGYINLNEKFIPGDFIQAIQKAHQNPDIHYCIIIDEMNIARVEYYFAEIMSRIEDRELHESGGYQSSEPVLNEVLRQNSHEYSQLNLPPNVSIVGTVNMDESTQGFSKKILDRAFTLELSDVPLDKWNTTDTSNSEPIQLPSDFWYPKGIRLGDIDMNDELQSSVVEPTIKELQKLNSALKKAQLQIGFRTRDEILLFLIHSKNLKSTFVRDDEFTEVKPFDLAIFMKILPRIEGGSTAIRRLLIDLISFAFDEDFQGEHDDNFNDKINKWSKNPTQFHPDAKYPITAARTCLMWQRIQQEGFTSFWL